MSAVVRGLLCAALVTSASVASAEPARPKAAPSASPIPPAKPSAPAPAAASPKQTAEPAPPSEPPPADAPTPPPTPSPVVAPAAPATPEVRVYMRAGTNPLLFSARAKNSDGTPTLCSAPCDAAFTPGDYQLRLNGVMVDGPVKLARPGTLEGKFDSHEAGREGGWLALNVGGILGGVFITVAALGGPSWAYVAGGGSLLSGGVLFVLTYRVDRASVSFTPGEPADVRGLPPPLPAQDNSSGPTPNAGLDRSDRPGFGGQARGLGFRITF